MTGEERQRAAAEEDARRFCSACNAAGWQCELPPGHEGRHAGGDHVWTGTVPWREEENAVLGYLLTAGSSTTAEITAALGGLRPGRTRPPLSYRRVWRHLKQLLRAKLVARTEDGRWIA